MDDSDAIMAGLAFILMIAFVALAVQIFVSYLLFEGMKRIPAKYRTAEPYYAWLMLIPFAGFVFTWILLPFRIPESLKSYFSENSTETIYPSDFGKGMGLASVISFTACIIPIINLVAWIPAVVCNIIYLVQFRKMVNRIPQTDQDKGMGTGDRFTQLERLKRLFDDGVLTAAEYESEKKKLI